MLDVYVRDVRDANNSVAECCNDLTIWSNELSRPASVRSLSKHPGQVESGNNLRASLPSPTPYATTVAI